MRVLAELDDLVRIPGIIEEVAVETPPERSGTPGDFVRRLKKIRHEGRIDRPSAFGW